jgi:hypothetical protein
MAIESANDERAPYVIWEMRPVEDRNASEAAGHTVEKDVAFCIVTRPGSRDTFEQVAEVWLEKLRKERQTWYTLFKNSYDLWKKGETGEIQGTPIKGWPVLGTGAQRTLIAAGIFSVEDLANMADQDLQNIGTGALAFKQKAKAWLDAANGPGKMAEKSAAQDAEIKALKELAATQAKAIDELKALVPKK